MPKFSRKSHETLYTCHGYIQKVFEEVIKNYDCTILTGHRGEEYQTDVFRQGLSKLNWPDSKHNVQPSLAIDAAPYPIMWQDKKRFYHFAGYVLGIADKLGVTMRWGGDWDSDRDLNDQSFMDLVHFELKGDKP